MSLSWFAREIWPLKWWIIVGSAALFAVMTFAVFQYRPTVKISILVNRLPVFVNSDFLDLNAALDKLIMPVKGKDSAKSNLQHKIDNDVLFTNFLEIVSRKGQFFEIIKRKVANEFPSDSDEEILDRTLDRIRGIKIIPPNSYSTWRGAVVRSALELRVEGWILTTQSKKPKEWINGIFEMFAEAGKLTKTRSLKNIRSLITESRLSSTFSIQDLKQQRAEAIIDYDTLLANQIAQLSEQAKIARSLDIPSNTIATIPVGSNPAVVTGINENSPPYFLGYKALEQQVNLMSNRSDKNLFIDKLAIIDSQIREHQNNPQMDRVEQLLDNSRLNEADFMVAEYGKERVSITNNFSKVILIPLAAILSCFLAFLCACMVIAVRWIGSTDLETSS